MTENKIPVIVGVTGHRQLRQQDRPALYAAVKAELQKLKALCPASPLYMMCSLCEGADLLCADAAAELGIPLIAVLPMAKEIYEKDFSPEGLQRFRAHCAAAVELFVAPPTEHPSPAPDRTEQFRQAGIYIAAHSQLLLALWDGKPGTRGCGTAEAVDFALHGNYLPTEGVALATEDNAAVIHIYTPRGETCSAPAGSVSILGSMPAVESVLRETDRFNRLAAELPSSERRILPEDTPEDPCLQRMDRVYTAASRCSRSAVRLYRRLLRLTAIISTVFTVGFVLYDDAHTTWAILICGLMLLCALACMLTARISGCHRKYTEYRALAEILRVQAFLRYAGSPLQAGYLLSWTQQQECAWIAKALCALNAAPPPEKVRDIRECWIVDQLEYHRNARKRSQHSHTLSDRVVNTALVLSLGIYLFALGFELLCGGLLFAPVCRVANPDLWRDALIISLGSISALTLFTANFYDRLSLPRAYADHIKMERFFALMEERHRQNGQTERLLITLAREELVENGNWYSYQNENRPELSL